MSVAKTIEILAEGDSIEEATEAAVREASISVKNVKHVYVDDFRAIVEDGKIETYRVKANVTFVVEN
ncbi:MAG TPA: dodecin family protein [Salinibacter sp.]|nr:dodecin family protein [Salinibacter sp.]